ncbi:MAG: DEAD/DEAH box helicase, partial [Rubrivivax sp.]
FTQRGWSPAPFQRAVWRHWLQGESGLLVTPTGSGKTLAAFGGALLEGLHGLAPEPIDPAHPRVKPSRLRLLWVTPLRALATDTTHALQQPIDALGLGWTVAKRTGDASSRDRRLARQGQAEVLVITPESLALLLSYPETAGLLKGLRGVIVDEWHELLGNKRGVLLQLGLARIRAIAPGAVTWGLSATLGNLDEARDVLLPHRPNAPVVRHARKRDTTLKTLLPARPERFAWAGHLGLSQLEGVMKLIAGTRSAILFTNTRAQAELWHRALSSIWLEPPEALALHHGSLDVGLRMAAEQGLRDGSVRCVVATSSLDLGVDFPTVDLVLQVGSPKGIARLLQRAGPSKQDRSNRADHRACRWT